MGRLGDADRVEPAAGKLDAFKVDAGPEGVGVDADPNDPVNAIVSLLLRLGFRLGPMILLTVRGRTSGLPRTTPDARVRVANDRDEPRCPCNHRGPRRSRRYDRPARSASITE